MNAQSLQLGRAPSILLHSKMCLLQFTSNPWTDPPSSRSPPRPHCHSSTCSVRRPAPPSRPHGLLCSRSSGRWNYPLAQDVKGQQHKGAETIVRLSIESLSGCTRLGAGGGGRAAAQDRCGGAAGEVADKLEAALGIPVLRHTEKKPAGGPQDLERHFGRAPATGGLPLLHLSRTRRLRCANSVLTWQPVPGAVHASRR